MSESIVEVGAVTVGSAMQQSGVLATQRWNVAVGVWSVVGVGATFVEAIYRLGTRAIGTIESGLAVREWVALAIGVLLLGYAEGYRALQRRFVPHVIERVLSPDVDYARSPASAVFAPLHAVALLGAGRQATLRAYASVGLIVAAVLVVRGLPHPWRGIVDAAVAVALSWGLVALMVQFVTALRATRVGAREAVGSTSVAPGPQASRGGE
jgi:hypothetical protein